MNFTDKGVYDDENMPDINDFRNLAMGTRVSPSIDVSPAFDIIDIINSGMVSWFSRPIDGTEIEVLTSVDGGDSWDKLIDGRYIQNVKTLNDDPTIHLKYIVKSYISQIRYENSPKLYSVVLILSSEEDNYWAKELKEKISWNDIDYKEISWSKDEQELNWG